MPQACLLLVHSPLVGPSSWRPLDQMARARGLDVQRPDLTRVAEAASPQWEHVVDLAWRAAEGHSDVVVVGHSGAGAMLPAIGERIGDRLRAMIFVDAVVPPAEGAHRTSEQLLDFIDGHAVDGRLEKWLDWWPTEVVDQLVPSPRDQAELRDDMPQLSRSFYDDAVPVPAGWATRCCAYLKLSAAYEDEYEMAAGFGWPRSEIDGTHLSIFTAPDAVLTAIEDLASRAGDRSPFHSRGSSSDRAAYESGHLRREC